MFVRDLDMVSSLQGNAWLVIATLSPPRPNWREKPPKIAASPSSFPQGGALEVRPTRPRAAWWSDRWLMATLLLTVAASIGSFVYFYVRGETVAYMDGEAHLMIAKRVLQSPTPGAGQLGGVWLPLPHLLMLPFIWSDTLFYSGIAGSVVSMVSFVATGVYLYLIIVRVCGDRRAGLIGSMVFVLNPNVLYMQSTPMSELPLFLFMAAAVYHFLRWSENPNSLLQMTLICVALVCGALTRYEAWVLYILLVPLMVYVSLRRGQGWKRTLDGNLVFFGFWASLGIVAWLVWNQLIFKDPLYFQNGEYANPSLWRDAHEANVGDLVLSFKTYWVGMVQNLHLGIIVLAGLGLVTYLYRTRLRAERLGPLVLLFPLPFFVLSLFTGQRPMRVEQYTGELYNLRFALVMILATAILIGFLISRKWWLQIAVAGIVLVSFGSMFAAGDIITREDPLVARESGKARDLTAASVWLEDHYDGGFVLMELFGNEVLQFESHVPLTKILYEGSNEIWEPALAEPDRFADWVVIRNNDDDPDKVHLALGDNSALTDRFEMVFKNTQIEIYRQIVPRALDMSLLYQAPSVPVLQARLVEKETEPLPLYPGTIYKLPDVILDVSPSIEPPVLVVYTVQVDDNLSSIAETFYGTQDWQTVYAANSDTIGADPDLILPGQTLRIPALSGLDADQPET